MKLQQNKLTKQEWNNVEVPIDEYNKYIINLIVDGFHNITINNNSTLTLIKYLKIKNTEEIDKYIFIKYIQEILLKIFKKNKMKLKNKLLNKKNKLKKLKKADILRISNCDKKIKKNKETIFEFIVLELFDKMLKYKANNSKKWILNYYTLMKVLKYENLMFNNIFKSEITYILDEFKCQIKPTCIIKDACNIIENNKYLLQYADDCLYEHQKQLFKIFNNEDKYKNKLVLYIAPTGTGKTMSPLGLSEKYKIIFVCAARHVGLSLARYAISHNKKIAFAFGCEHEDDRLHYHSAKEYTKNRKSGGIWKVDNSVGDKVEIIISDIKSYIHSMNYMLKFNEKENIILYWDEPTITLDYQEHEYHAIIKNNWTNNIIPNIVLCSATLPNNNEIHETINDYKTRFNNSEVYNISTSDYKKSIKMINKEGYIEMPHYLYDNYEGVKHMIEYLKNNKTLYRYVDLNESIHFITYINDNKFMNDIKYEIKNYFENIEYINMNTIKEYYFNLLNNIKNDKWVYIHNYFINKRVKEYDNADITTKDAHTLTDGPTIFLTKNISNISEYYLNKSNIPVEELDNIMKIINLNDSLNSKISNLETKINDEYQKHDNTNNDKEIPQNIQILTEKINIYKTMIKNIQLNKIYIPNTKEHLYIHNTIKKYGKSFTSKINDKVVEEIMLINDIEHIWKILLLMGIGVFVSHKSEKYMNIMKKLAMEQKLYLIIASPDFIYGTNYQFCHCYLSQDLSDITQEKCIQALGRVGRNKLQYQYTIRFLDNNLIYKLLNKQENKQEVVNMNKLFNSN